MKTEELANFSCWQYSYSFSHFKKPNIVCDSVLIWSLASRYSIMMSLPVDEHKLVHANGKHTACGIQHELTMHTDVLDAHSPVALHDSMIEHKQAGAQ